MDSSNAQQYAESSEKKCSNQKWIDEAVAPTDEYIQKGAKSLFKDIRARRHVVEGHAPIPAAPARAFVPRRAKLSQKDSDEFGYTGMQRL